jgi:site-specific DNA-methyltransferase (adenine-specific)
VEVSVNLYNDDCFNVLKTLPDESVDLVLTDPPYGTTAIQWDKVLDFNKMWDELDRVVKPKSNIILFASQPFTSLLVTTKLDWFRYELVWNKNKCGSPGLAKKRPQKVHENILLFSKESGGLYNPIMEEGNKSTGSSNSGTRYPKSILHGSRNFSAQQTVHPTQKPTNVLNWLIMTYSNQNDVVLDFTMGSGSTGVSSKLTGRSFVGIEKDKDYFEIAKKRIDSINIDTFEPLVTIKDFQLTTQIDKSMKTTPDKKYEELS